MDFLGSVEQTIAVCAAVVTLVSSTVTFVAKFIKANKARAAEFKKATAAKKAQMLLEFAMASVQSVETIKSIKDDSLKPEAKKEIALTKINQLCIDNGIEFDAEEAGRLIEEVVSLTKKVNQRDKDKTATAETSPPTSATSPVKLL